MTTDTNQTRRNAALRSTTDRAIEQLLTAHDHQATEPFRTPTTERISGDIP
ncbi:hypothetical protein [Actinomyces sp. oral taxon 170]|uniref:hypothetical protein n=1 Tax=Actinomyces sp. oral taxon 170 TaxID=712117 RepID=UPI000205B367|nr:hypothetical protein [Actinomyces sp. oral taxon 170]EGF52266.1 hypothetical protein HMPREF9056_02582 [Actinomyces sp. oral taxon 170 str. F0386]